VILDATNKSIRAYMGGAAATTNPAFATSYVDHTSTTFAAAANDGALNGATPVTLVAAPGASTQRQVKYLNVYNLDTVAQTVTVELLNNATQRTLVKVVLEVGDQLIFSDAAGWVVLNSSGAPKAAGLVAKTGTFLRSVFDAANLTATLTLTSNSTFVVYLGTCPKASSSIVLRYRVTTAAATITWAEVGIFRGAVNIGGNPTLTRLGTLDVSGVINSTGIKSSTVSLSTAAAVGDDLWAAVGNQATTAGIVRGALADDIQSGILTEDASVRPSTVASPNTFTIAAANRVVPWVTALVS